MPAEGMVGASRRWAATRARWAWGCLLFLGLTVASAAPGQESPAPGDRDPSKAAPILGRPTDWGPDWGPESGTAATLVDVPAGSRLYERPASAARVLRVLPEAKLGALEWQGPWARVTFEDLEGWVLLDDDVRATLEPMPREDGLDEGRAPPELEAELLDTAWGLLQEGSARQGSLGGLPLYTDSLEDEVLELLARVAAQVPEAYSRRYGLAARDVRPRRIVLFDREDSYRAFHETVVRRSGAEELDAGFVGLEVSGIVAFYAQGRGRHELTKVLVHELGHVLNRALLGPGLPYWLNEGLAEDLAISRISARGRLDPDALSRPVERGQRLFAPPGSPVSVVTWLRMAGGLALVKQLADAERQGTLPAVADLVAKDRHAFLRTPTSYAHAALLVRYLVGPEDPGLAQRFQGFLRSAASGGPTGPAALWTALGRDPETLDEGFRSWLRRTERGLVRVLR